MPTEAQARDLVETVKSLRDQVETLDDPERVALLLDVKRLKDQVDVLARRAMSEAAREASGIGAAPFYRRLT